MKAAAIVIAEVCGRCRSMENIVIHNGASSLCAKCKKLLNIGNGVSILYGKTRTIQEHVINWKPDARGKKKADKKQSRAFFVRMQLTARISGT